MTQSFPPAHGGGPTSKERKYDRQLRLWAASGQQTLEESRVLLVNSDGPVDSDNAELTGVVGVEALKNLVLPGVGGFSIVDPATVTEPDLGVNFFLSEESLGKSRAEETCNYLRELNSDVDGGFYTQPILDLLKDETFLPQFQLVIVTGPMKQCTLRTISQTTKLLEIPLIYTRSIGFYATFSLQLPSIFPVSDTHPDPSSTQDLRLTNPWPELTEAARKIDHLDSMDDHQHGHVPYLLLLLHFLQKWKANHDGQYPQNYREKTEFRDMVRSSARTGNPEGGEENFDEAVAAVLKSLSSWSLSSGLRDIFELDQCAQLTSASDSFYIIMSAVKAFHEKHGILPLPGSLPDMKSQSADYIDLQNIYKSQARLDLAEVVDTVRETEARLLGVSREAVKSPMSEKEIEAICKNAAHVKIIRGRDIPFISPADKNEDIQQATKTIRNNLGNPESLIPIFLALTTLDTLVTEYKETKSASKQTSSSISYLQNPENWTDPLSKLLTRLEIDNSDDNKSDNEGEPRIKHRIDSAAAEVRRAGAGELHNISAMAGGCVAQESLKVLTKQYLPLDNTFVFDGVKCRGEMFRL